MRKHTFAVAAGLAALMPMGALADIDARSLWTDWQETGARLGLTLEASAESFADGTLTLDDVTGTTITAGSEQTVNYGRVRLVERGDGTVDVMVDPESGGTSLSEIEGIELETTTTFGNDGLSIIVSETEDGVRLYDIEAEEITVTILQSSDDPRFPTTTIEMQATDIEATHRFGRGNPDAFDYVQQASSIGLISNVALPNDDAVELTYGMTDLVAQSTGLFGPTRDTPAKGLSDLGLTLAVGATFDSSTATVSAVTPQGPIDIEATSGVGEFTVDVGSATVGFGSLSRDNDISMRVPQFPFPVGLTIAETGTRIAVPYGPPGGDSPFSLRTTVRDAAVDEVIWSLFDPTGQLPRDPLSLTLDLDGTVEMAVDIFGDPEAVEALRGAPPGQLTGLSINDLLVEGLGALLTGEGELTFPNAGGPFPQPVGTIDLALSGGLALMDRFVALGILPAQQAAFAKGMAGVVAQTVGEDELESTIEFAPDGGISANGLTLR